MIEPDHPRLSVTRQCELVSISRSGFYSRPAGETPLNLELMRLIDAQFLEAPWYGSRQMARHLRREGYTVGRKRVRRLMARMGLAPIYQRPCTTVPHPEHRVYPYLLRDLVIDRPNQVWCADLTYIPMRRGFLYLVAIVDWATRKVLSWRVSNRDCLEIGGVRPQPLFATAGRWQGRISVRSRNRTCHYRRRSEPEAVGRRPVATNASAVTCSSGGSPGSWRCLR